MDRQSDPAYDWQDDLELLKRRACVGRNDIVYDSAAVSTSGKILKYAEGKPKLGLVPTLLTHHLARVYEYGISSKYAKDSWQEFDIEDARELIHSALRHIDEYRDGRYISDENLYGLMQAIWNLTTIHWHEYHKNIDYREGRNQDASVPDLR